MDFRAEIVVPSPAERLWSVLTDFRRAAACVPGCEEIEEVLPLERYRAVIRRRVGPFRVEVPIDIVMEALEEGASLRARATGRDTVSGTSVSANLRLSLARAADAETRLAVTASIQVSGRLASLGFPMIRRQTEDAFDEFGARLRQMLGAS